MDVWIEIGRFEEKIQLHPVQMCGLMGFVITTLINDKKDKIKILFEIIVGFVTVNLFVPNIDNIAHFSGLFSGLVFGFIFMKYCKHEKMNEFFD